MSCYAAETEKLTGEFPRPLAGRFHIQSMCHPLDVFTGDFDSERATEGEVRTRPFCLHGSCRAELGASSREAASWFARWLPDLAAS